MGILFSLKSSLITFSYLTNAYIQKTFKSDKNSFVVTALVNSLRGYVGYNSSINTASRSEVYSYVNWINTFRFFNKPELINSLESI